MSYAQDMPIYKDAYDLLVLVMKLTQNFPRISSITHPLVLSRLQLLFGVLPLSNPNRL